MGYQLGLAAAAILFVAWVALIHICGTDMRDYNKYMPAIVSVFAAAIIALILLIALK